MGPAPGVGARRQLGRLNDCDHRGIADFTDAGVLKGSGKSSQDPLMVYDAALEPVELER